MTFDTVTWPDFISTFRWKQGEHAAIIKPTGGGKTTLEGQLLKVHRSPAIVVFVTKVFDKTFSEQFSDRVGWRRVYDWPPPRHYSHVLLWPKHGKTIPETQAIQRNVFRKALDSIFLERGWTVVFDEEHYMCQDLGLSQHVAMFHHQGRSSGLTCVDGIQRPKFVPVITYSSATHAFIGNTTDSDDLRRLADLGSRFSADIKREAMDLDYYEFLYVPARARNATPVRTTVQLRKVA